MNFYFDISRIGNVDNNFIIINIILSLYVISRRMNVECILINSFV